MAGHFADLVHQPRSLVPLLSAGVQLALALFLLLRRGGELRLRVWFGALVLSSATWAAAVALSLGTDSAHIAHQAATVSFAAIAVAGPFGLAFSVELTRQQVRVAPFVAISAGCVALIVLVPSWIRVAPRPAGGYWPLPSPSLVLAMIGAMLPMTRGNELIRRAWQAQPPSRRRRQLGWSLAAVSVGLVGGYDVLTVFLPLYPIGWASGVLSCGLLFHAIAQHRLMAIRTVAQEALLGTLGAVVAAGVLYAITSHHAGLSRGALGLIAFALFVTTRGWLSVAEPVLAKLLARRRRLVDRALADFERRSLDAHEPAVVRRQLADALHDGFDAELVSLLLADRPRDAEPILLDTAEALVTELGTPVLRDLLDLDAAASRDLLTALDHLRADGLVPLMRDNALLGLAVVRGPGLHPADDRVAQDLAQLGERAARALTNARLYREVERRGRGLEAQVKLRTAELEGALVELKTAQARLVDAERSSSLGLLVAGISHEINNALNFISANLPTLSRYAEAGDEVLAQAPAALVAIEPRVEDARAQLPGTIAALQETTRRTGAIVGDLRKFARPDTERRLFRLDEGLDAALNLLRRRTDGRLDVARVYIGNPSIDCYPGPLNQCFFNLLLNAVQAARSEVWVILRERGDRGGAEVLICDDGPGIDADDLEQVFQPFFTTKPKAAGLGLTVAKGVIERHAGSLLITSEPGHGATVHVRLPPRAPEPRRPPTTGDAA